MTTSKIGRLLIIDDRPKIIHYLLDGLKEDGWTVVLKETPDEGYAELKEFRSSFAGVLVVLELPPKKNTFKGGLNLVDKIRLEWADIPIVAYTERMIEPIEAVRRLPMSRASFFDFYDKDGMDVLRSNLDLLLKGWLFYNPKVAVVLPNVIAQKPDPLKGSPSLWYVLELISNNPEDSYELIEKKARFAPGYIGPTANRIMTKLGDQLTTRSRDGLKEWFKLNYMRYRFMQPSPDELNNPE